MTYQDQYISKERYSMAEDYPIAVALRTRRKNKGWMDKNSIAVVMGLGKYVDYQVPRTVCDNFVIMEI